MLDSTIQKISIDPVDNVIHLLNTNFAELQTTYCLFQPSNFLFWSWDSKVKSNNNCPIHESLATNEVKIKF